MKYLSVSEVAGRLGNHEKTVRRYISSGELQAKKIGGQWRIAEEWFGDFLSKDECAHSASPGEDDFCIYMDSDFFASEDEIQVCSIIDVHREDRERVRLIIKSKAYDLLQENKRLKIESMPHHEALRIVIWGCPDVVQAILKEIQ